MRLTISLPGLNQKVLAWNDLKAYQCLHHNLESSLQNTVFCQQCLFPKKGQYQNIPATLDLIEDEIEDLYSGFEKSVVKEVRVYRDNMQFLEKAEKKLVQEILDEKKLPDLISSQMIQAINKLFKEIDIVEMDRDSIITTLFPNEEMITMEDLRKRFYAFVEDLKKNRQENEIRIKLKFNE